MPSPRTPRKAKQKARVAIGKQLAPPRGRRLSQEAKKVHVGKKGKATNIILQKKGGRLSSPTRRRSPSRSPPPSPYHGSPIRRRTSSPRRSPSPVRRGKSRSRRVPLKKDRPILGSITEEEFYKHRWSASEILQMLPLFTVKTSDGFKRWLMGAMRIYDVNKTPKNLSSAKAKRIEFIAKVETAVALAKNCGRKTVLLKDGQLADDIIAGATIKPLSVKKRK